MSMGVFGQEGEVLLAHLACQNGVSSPIGNVNTLLSV